MTQICQSAKTVFCGTLVGKVNLNRPELNAQKLGADTTVTVSPFTQHEKYKGTSNSYGVVVSHSFEIQVYHRAARCENRLDRSIEEARQEANRFIRGKYLEFVADLEGCGDFVVRVIHDI